MEEVQQQFPTNWQIGQDFDPNSHLIQIERFDKRTQRKVYADYLTVQNRLLWFIRDQRALTVAGLAKLPYLVQTELVELDREAGWAHFKTCVRDVLGNMVTMYGSESIKDFPDYAEKASTKSLGRALLALGYGTAFAPEMDEGERVVDAPVERHASDSVRQRPMVATIREAPPARKPAVEESATTGKLAAQGEVGATEQQLISIRKLCAALGKDVPAESLTYAQARELLSQLSGEYRRARQAS
ncbi:MAG: hypothetical protein ACLQUY_10525 [Ktedonobacterales bacterium]